MTTQVREMLRYCGSCGEERFAGCGDSDCGLADQDVDLAGVAAFLASGEDLPAREEREADTRRELQGLERVVRYEGVLMGLERGTGPQGCWAFEGCGYDTPADEGTVVAAVSEALTEPTRAMVERARDFVFGQGGSTYTSEALLAMLVAYEAECEGGDGVRQVVEVLREAARRIAVIEALTI